MKTTVFKGFYILIGLIALVFFSCAEETLKTQSNNGTYGTLSYSWSQSLSGDTVILSCNQVINYQNNKGSHTLTPVATVKLVAQSDLLEYAQDKDPTPVYLKTSSNSGYEGSNPRCRVINQDLFFNDGQIITAILTMPLHSYYESGRELFFPHIEFQELLFRTVSLVERNGYVYPTIEFSVPWSASTGDDNGYQTISVSYVKQAVAQADRLLRTSYNQGVDWLSNSSFSTYVEKTETWLIGGDKKSKTSSPPIPFMITATDNRSVEVSNFDFVGKLTPNTGTKEDLSKQGWTIKKREITQTVNFTNGTDFFSDVFSYPLYDVSFVLDGQTFDFDLSVDFNENYQITLINASNAKNTTAATITVAQKSFEKNVVTTMTKKSTPPVNPTSKYGKVLDFSVTAVFDPDVITNKSGNITKKCVMIRYEKGYEWGVCTYDNAFPTSYTFTETSFGSFDSVAKKNGDANFQPARTVQSNSSILWYDANNRQISGIDALTCKIYGWSNIVNGVYASAIEGYSAEFSDNSYTITIKAPGGQTKTFSSY